MGLREKAKGLKDAAAQGANRLGQGEIRNHADFQLLKDAAIEASGVAGRKGKVKGWRVAKAAINPRGTATRVARGVGNEALRQYRSGGHDIEPVVDGGHRGGIGDDGPAIR